MENNPFDFSKDAKGPDLRGDKQKKSDWMEHMVEFKNPNLKKGRPRLNFPEPTEEEKKFMAETDMYGNPRKPLPPQTDLYGNIIEP